MQKLDLSQVPNDLKPNPIFKGLPEFLKDPKNFLSTEKRLVDILINNHKHKTASSYVKCEECQKRREERKQMMKDIGFKSMSQYLEWKKVMKIIIDKKDFQVR